MAQRRKTPKNPASKAKIASPPSPQELVETFLAQIERLEFEGLGEYFTESAVYQNMPLPAIRGKKRIKVFLERGMKGLKSFEVEMIHIAVSGNAVLTERIDRITIGDATLSVPIMGIFVVEDGKFSAWRDYFDLWQVVKQVPKALPAILLDRIVDLIPR